MSEMNKPPEEAGVHAPAEENAKQEKESVATPGQGTEVPMVAAAQDAPASPAPPLVTPADPLELEEWNRQVRARMRRQTRRGFIGLGAGLLLGAGAFEWLTSRRALDTIPWPFRKTLEVNEQLAHDYLATGRLAPTFPATSVTEDRVNGEVGLDEDVDISSWKLQVEGLAAQDEPLMLELDAIKKLPRMEMITEFKCIEGWSVIVKWAGARFTDFMKAFPPETQSGNDFSLDRADDMLPYVSMETPGGDYFVGLDVESMLHPQTMLCYEQNGAPLTQDHGAPLRLVTPVKYGVKNLKRIGTIRYTRARPADYWAERGYDWYIGL